MRISPLLLIVILSISGCASLKDQVKSRELLAKCEYRLSDISVEKINFDQMVKLVNSAKEVDFKNPGKEVLPLLQEIKDLNFDINFTTLDFEANLNVKNPNAHPVVMDSVQFDAFLDDQFIMKAANGSRLDILAKSEGAMPIMLNVPTDVNLKKVVKSENIRMKGRVWLRIELIKGLPITLPFNFDVKQKVPREELQKVIDAQKKKMMERMVKELAGGKVKDLLKKF